MKNTVNWYSQSKRVKGIFNLIEDIVNVTFAYCLSFNTSQK